MKTSFTTLAVLAAMALAAPSFAQGNAFFSYQDHLPSRAERQELRREQASQRPYALTGSQATRAERTPVQRSVQAPGNGFTPVEMPVER